VAQRAIMQRGCPMMNSIIGMPSSVAVWTWLRDSVAMK